MALLEWFLQNAAGIIACGVAGWALGYIKENKIEISNLRKESLKLEYTLYNYVTKETLLYKLNNIDLKLAEQNRLISVIETIIEERKK